MRASFPTVLPMTCLWIGRRLRGFLTMNEYNNRDQCLTRFDGARDADARTLLL